ncbi:hypothetical protein [Stackebrandtia soli]|uniref:phage tail tube protein n=1 Tax=Stackebrandtia soli TaxID=1892856 RepID=UPI0039EA0394
MALDDSTLVIPGVGYVFTAPTGTARPTDPSAPDAAWTDLGHSSEDGLTVTFEIEKTVRRTWRSRAGVRESIDEITFTLGWTALQVDNEALSAYFGGGDVAAEGVFGVLKSPGALEKALFIRLVDGAAEVDFYAAKASLGPGGEATASPEDFTGFPLQATVLDHASAAHLAEWLAPHLGTPAPPPPPPPAGAAVNRKDMTRG